MSSASAVQSSESSASTYSHTARPAGGGAGGGKPFPPALVGLVDWPRWIGWRWKRIEGRDPAKREGWAKVAMPIDGGTLRRREAGAVERGWAGLREAMAVVIGEGAREAGIGGVGWVPVGEDGLVFVDLDGCRDPVTGVVSEAARGVIEACGSYAEVSPSGTGVRIIGGSDGWGGADKGRFKWLGMDGSIELAGEVYFNFGYVTVTLGWLDGYGDRWGKGVGGVAQALVDDNANEAWRARERTARGGNGVLDPGRDREAPIEVVRALLAWIPNEGGADWDWWVSEVGLAVWGATGGSEEGLAAWDEWSRRCRDWVEGSCEEAWWRIGGSPPDGVGWGKLEILGRSVVEGSGGKWQPGLVVEGWKEAQSARKRADRVWGVLAGLEGGGRLERVVGLDSGSTAPWYTEATRTPEDIMEARGGGDGSGEVEGPPVLHSGTPYHSATEMFARQWITPEGRTLHGENGGFLQWAGQRYVDVPAVRMRKRVWDFLEHAVTTGEKGELMPFKPTGNKVTNVVDALTGIAELDDGEGRVGVWPRWAGGGEGNDWEVRNLVAFSNGIMNIETGAMRGHTPRFLNRVVLPYPWLGEGEENGGCAEWLRFLGSLWGGDSESIEVLQEMMGLFMTGDTGFQKAFMIIGPARSGKGTIALVIRKLLGADNVVDPTLSDMGDRFGLEPLLHKRLAVLTDVRIGQKTDVAGAVEKLLAITGEDAVTVLRKYRASWTGKLNTRFLMLANMAPKLDDSSAAIMNRFIVLRTVESWLGREDRRLGGRLLAELPGIAAWALAGLKRLRIKDRIETPASAREMAQEFTDLGDPVGQWLREECEIGEDYQEQRVATFMRWRAWCQAQGWTHLWNMQMFGRNLRAALPTLRDVRPRGEDAGTRGTRYYLGLRSKSGDGGSSGGGSNVIPLPFR